MGKGPILLLGAAAVAGIAIAVHAKSQEASTSSAAAPSTASKGTSAQDLTTAQKKKLEDWAKSKGVPVDKAYALAKDLFATKF